MVCYEGRGIPVDVPAKNLWNDVERGVDQVLLAGLKKLESAGR
jgi:hypothetical protein